MSDDRAWLETDRPDRLPPSYARVELAVLMRRTEANLMGNIHGGEIMKLADATAASVAQRHSGGPAVTATMDEMSFLHPVQVGDIVHTFAQVNWTGRTSMEVGVHIEAEPWNAPGESRHVSSGYFVMVAIDAQHRSRPIPQLVPETPDEERRQREAAIRRSSRLARRAEIDAARAAR